MALTEELQTAVAKILREQLTTRDGRLVPAPENLRLGNDAINLDATVLYADMADSTQLVNDYEPTFAAEIYKAYLTCAAKIVKSEGERSRPTTATGSWLSSLAIQRTPRLQGRH
jgi:class 3 adenylate cyclase